MQGGRKSRLFSCTYLNFFLLTLCDYLTQGASRKIWFMLFIVFNAWYLLWLWAGPVRGSGFWQIPGTRLRHINNLRKRGLGTIMLCLQSHLQSWYFLWPLHQSRSSSNLFLMSIKGVWNNCELLTICLVKLISILLNYKIKDNIDYHGMFVGKLQINYISLKKKGKRSADIMLIKLM